MQKVFAQAYFVFMIVLLASCSSANQDSPSADSTVSTQKAPALESKIKLVNPTQFAQIAQKGEALVLDVRTPEELTETGFIKGAEHLNFRDDGFEKALAEFDKNKPVAVYCKSGGRSGNTAEILKKMGFKTIYDLDGGITAWLDASMETIKE